MGQKTHIYKFRCTVERMYNDCPKPDGWFGCIAGTDEGGIRLTGTFPYKDIRISEQMVLDIEAYKDLSSSKYKDSYKAVDIKLIIDTPSGLRACLASLPFLTRTEISKIVRTIGRSAPDVFSSDITRIQEMNKLHGINLTDEKVEKLYNALVSVIDDKQRVIKQMLPEIASRQKTIEKICDAFPDLMDIKKHPYALLQIPRLSFKIVDTIALRFGISPTSDERLEHAVEYELSKLNGDLFVNLSDNNEFTKLYTDTLRLLSISLTSSEFAQAISRISQSDGCFAIDTYNGESHLYLRHILDAVNLISKTVCSYKYNDPINVDDSVKYNILIQNLNTDGQVLNNIINEYEAQHFALTDEQKTAIINAVKYPMSIITGGPGRGKTTIIDCLIYTYKAVFKLIQSPSHILLLAPTGKAMNKLRSSIHADDFIETKTIDAVLTAIEKNIIPNHLPNEYDSPTMLVIIDESSMIDVCKAARIFRHLSRCRFCFVGDADQLPPISPGAFFQDLLRADLSYIPVSHLTTPMRNTGVILKNAEKVNNNDTGLTFNFTDMPFFAQNGDDDNALNTIIDTYNDERMDYPDISKIALICPVRKGVIGTDNINMTIQNIVCPEKDSDSIRPVYDKHRQRYMFTAKGYTIQSTYFGNSARFTRLRVGDVVMNTKNKIDIEAYRYKHNDYFKGDIIPYSKSLGIYNGDCGRIIAYVPPEDVTAPRSDESSHEYLIIQLFDNRFVELDITDGDTEDISLGYAVTVHKSQGSEYDSVIYVSPKQLMSFNSWDNRFICKNLVYTAFTRAKQKLTVIGSKDSLNACISTNLKLCNDNLSDRLINKI